MKHPYKLVDGRTETLICVYASQTVALRDCAKKNAAIKSFDFYVQRIKDGKKFTAKGG